MSKLNLTPREIWILMGNKIREIYEATWIDYIIQKINVDILIISDLRFRNEAIAIKKAKGTLIKIERNTTRSFDPAEVDLDNWTDWDLIIDNNGTLSDLNKKIEQLALNLMLGENNG